MTISFLMRTPIWAQYGPPLALLARRNWSRPVLWVAAGALVSNLGNILGRIAAHRVQNNHWVGYIDSALMYSLYLIALSEWQVTPRAERGARTLIFTVLVIYLLLVGFVEDVSTFSVFAAPLYAVSLMGLGIWTMLRRTMVLHQAPVLRTDWFWVAGGLTLYGATTAVAEPVSRILLESRRLDLFYRVYDFRAVCIDLAFIAITAGMLIPPSPRPDRP